MKPEQFIRDFGVKKAREVVEGAPDWAKGYYEPTGQYQDQEWSDEMSVGIEDLKRLVVSLDLIKSYGGIEQCRKEIEWVETSKLPETDLVKELKRAIAVHESIYGGGDDL